MPEPKREKLDAKQIMKCIGEILYRIKLESKVYVEQMRTEDYHRYLQMSTIAKIENKDQQNEEIKKLAIKDGTDEYLRKYFDLLGDQINDVILTGFNWLQRMCQDKNLEMVKLILTYSRHINVNQGAPNTPTPFESACGVEEPDHNPTPEELSRSLNIVKAFLETGKLDVSKCKINPLCTACARSSVQLVFLLLKNAEIKKLNINKESIAFYNESQDPKAVKNSPLSIACLSKNPANLLISKMLVESGAKMDVNTSLSKNDKIRLNLVYDEIPLFYLACMNGHVDVIKNYFAHPATNKNILNVEFEYKTPLYYAVINNQLEVLKLLMEKGANVNARCLDDKGKETTALHQACIHGNIEIVRQLLTYQDSNVNSEDELYKTPLHYAVINNQLDVLKLLIEKGANVNAVFLDANGNETTALHQACIAGNIEIVRQLLTCKDIYLNPQNKKKITPLFAAFLNDHNDIVKLLIDRDEVELQDVSGATLFLLACVRLNLEILKYAQKKRPSEFKQFINKIEQDGTSFTFYTFINTREGNSSISPKVFQVMDFLLENGANIEGEPDSEVEIPDKTPIITPLMIACNFGINSMIDYLIKKGASVEYSFYKTCQMDATENKFKIDKLKVCSMLIKIGAVIKVAFNIGLNLKDKEVIDFLIKNYSDAIVSTASKEMYDYLEKDDIKFLFDILCETDRLDIAKFLLEDPERFKKAFDDTPPLLIACQKNAINIIDLLIQKGADASHSFYLALQRGDTTSAELLFMKKEIDYASIFVEACIKGDEIDKQILEFIIKKADKPTDLIRSGLFIALEHNKEDIVKHLLKYLSKGEDKKLDLEPEKGMTLFCLACQKGQLSAVKTFLKYKINVNKPCTSNNFSPLHFACENKHSAIVKELLENENLVLDCINSSKETPLYLAIKQKSKDIAKELITHGASKDKVLELACTNGDLEIIEYLKKEFGFAVDRPVDGNKTALHLACENGHFEIVKFLLEKNDADVNSTTNGGSTPLHLACKNGHAKIAKLLIDPPYFADKDLVNNKGEKPADVAKKDNKALQDLFGLTVKTAQPDPDRQQYQTSISSLLFSSADKKIKIKKASGKEEKEEDKKEIDSPLNNLSTMEEEKEDQSNIAEVSPYKIYTLHDGTLIHLPRMKVHPLTKGKEITTQFPVEKYEIYYDNKKSSHIEGFAEVAEKAEFYPGKAKSRSCIHGLDDDIFSIKIVNKTGSDYRVLGTVIGTGEDGKQLIYFQKTVRHENMGKKLQNKSKLKQQLIDLGLKEVKKVADFVDKPKEVRSVVSGNKT